MHFVFGVVAGGGYQYVVALHVRGVLHSSEHLRVETLLGGGDYREYPLCLALPEVAPEEVRRVPQILDRLVDRLHRFVGYVGFLVQHAGDRCNGNVCRLCYIFYCDIQARFTSSVLLSIFI